MQVTEDDTDRILSLAGDVGVPDHVGDMAASIHRQAIEAGFNRVGDGREVPAAVYAAARVEEYPVKPSSLASAFDRDGVDEDDVVSDMRRLIDALPYDVSIEKPAAYVERYCDELGVNGQYRETALSLCEDATDDHGYAPSGKSVSTFAAAVVYAAGYLLGEKGVSQESVADVADVSAVGIRKRYRDVIRKAKHADYTGDPPNGDRAAIRITVDRIIDTAGDIPDVVGEDARSIVDDLPEADWVETTNPKGVAAGVVYVAARDNRVSLSQDYVADVAGVSKGTVVSRVKDLRSWRGEVESRRNALDAVRYNDLKRLAGENGIDVGQAPERDYLIDRLAKAGVEPVDG